MSFLGLSFGASQESNKTSSTGLQNIFGTQNQSQTENSTKDTSSTTDSSGSSSTKGTSASTSNQSGSTTQTGTTQQQQTTTSQSLSDPILSAASAALMTLFGGNSASGAASAAAAKAGAFDPEAYVANAMQKSTQQHGNDLTKNIAAVRDMIGGKMNSMSQLLTGQLQNDSASSLAGDLAASTKEAYGINDANITAANAAGASQNDFLANLLNVVKGAQTTQVGSGVTQQAQSGTSAATDSTSGATTSDQVTQQKQQQNTIETLTQALQALLTSNQTTNTKTDSKSSGSKTSEGMSLGF